MIQTCCLHEWDLCREICIQYLSLVLEGHPNILDTLQTIGRNY